MQITIKEMLNGQLWTVSRPDHWRAVASIRKRGNGYFDVKTAACVLDMFPNAREFEMDGFCNFDAAKAWCAEIAASIWPAPGR